MSNDIAVAECLNGEHQNIPGNGLHGIFRKFGTVAFQTLPLFRSTHTFVGNRLATELVLSHAWFYIGKLSAGWKCQKQESALIVELQAVGFHCTSFLYAVFYGTVDIPPQPGYHGIGISPRRHKRLQFFFRNAHLQGSHCF